MKDTTTIAILAFLLTIQGVSVGILLGNALLPKEIKTAQEEFSLCQRDGRNCHIEVIGEDKQWD